MSTKPKELLTGSDEGDMNRCVKTFYQIRLIDMSSISSTLVSTTCDPSKYPPLVARHVYKHFTVTVATITIVDQSIRLVCS